MKDWLDDDEKLEKHFDQTQEAVMHFVEAEELDPDRMPLWKVAQAFNVSAQVVERWVKAGLPRNPDGTFAWGVVLEWKISGKTEEPV